MGRRIGLIEPEKKKGPSKKEEIKPETKQDEKKEEIKPEK